MKFYRSSRVAKYHPDFRPYGEPPPPPKYQPVMCYPPDHACPSRIAIVGENPGADEDQAGFPFVGRSGEELDRFLDTYGIDPDSTLITNIGRIYNIGNNDPTDDDIKTWEYLLHEELNDAKPYWIVAVGRVSTRYFLGDVNMEAVHGVPYFVVLDWLDNGRGGRVVVVPVYHPAAGFHSTEMQAAIAYDFQQLDATLHARLTPRDPFTADQFPEPSYRDLGDGLDDLETIRAALSGGSRSNVLDVAIDTEGLPGKPWGLSFSVRPGEAFVIRKIHGTALSVFHTALLEGIRDGRLHVVLHNSLHDLRVLRELHVPIPEGSFTDTMVLAYHLCIEPQGLKPLAYRHAGMEMESYDEQVQDAQDRIAVEYYEAIEALCMGGIVYERPEIVAWTFTTKRKLGKRWTDEVQVLSEERPTELEAWTAVSDLQAEGYKCSKPKKVTVPPSGPLSVGPFQYIHPYTILERDKATGQLKQRVKTPQQVDRRVNKAMEDLRSGKITAAQLRDRWNNTDEMVTEVVEEVLGPMREADLDDVPLPRAIRYAARDADATERIAPILRERHTALNLTYVGQIDHSIIPMVDRMQEVGYPVNKEYFIWLSGDLKRRMVEVQEQIRTQFGVWINPNSGEQVADLLFRPVEEGGYGLTPTKLTKGKVDKETGETKGRRGSTQDKVLEGLRNDHPIVPLILDYRGLSKAKTSFADVVIRRAVFESGMWVVHCNFRITRVSSGRLSATGPNLLAIMGGDLGLEIRIGYEAGTGYELGEWDLSQIEMRVMASEADDAFLISMIANDEDIHAGTAGKMFGLNLSRPYHKKQVAKDKRDAAKRTGFGVITGIQAPGLVDQMRLQGRIVSENEAAQWIVDWLASCPAVPVYMDKCHREARRFGYVRDWAGRIRYLPGIHSPFRHVRAEAGRQSHSHKIQGGAQEIMKLAMHMMWNEVLPYWRSQGRYIEPILQIHDAIKFRMKGFTAEDKQMLDAQVRACFYASAPPGFKVPLDAGNGYATTWGELEH